MFEFIQSQISLVWLFVFYTIFLPRNLKLWKSIFIFSTCTAVCIFLSYLFVLQNGSAGAMIANVLLQGLLIQLTVYVVCKYHDGRALFVGLTGAHTFFLGV